MKYPRRHLASQATSSQQAGFTIVELMIATLVFSVVLLVITVGVLNFTSSYYKGINSSTTQTAAQNAIDIVSQATQFDAGTVTPTDGTQGHFCAGSKLFIYTLGVRLNGAPATGNWGLYELDSNGANCTMPSPVPANGVELLGQNMRVSDILVSNSNPAANLWQISLSVVYGDSDLLCNSNLSGTTTGACGRNAPAYAKGTTVKGSDVSCRSQTGSQFCSVASLSTVAQQRIAN